MKEKKTVRFGMLLKEKESGLRFLASKVEFGKVELFCIDEYMLFTAPRKDFFEHYEEITNPDDATAVAAEAKRKQLHAMFG